MNVVLQKTFSIVLLPYHCAL